MDPLAMSGLELLQGMIDGKIPHPSMADTIPMHAVEAARGYLKFRVRAYHRHLSPLGHHPTRHPGVV
jgi:hypothetical protein